MAPTPQETPVLRDYEEPLEKHKVVISGMSGLYPNCHNVKEFSETLYNKVNPITEVNRWDYDHPEVSKFSGHAPELDRFDAQFFSVHSRLSHSMDTMSRKILEQSYQAIIDAGVNPEQLNGKNIGVFIGSCFSESEKACFYISDSRSGFGLLGISKTMFANRVSYWLNTRGPSMLVDESCCSSIGALKHAYQAIATGRCEAAIVGGSSLSLHPQSSVHYGRIMKLSMDGKTRSFDMNAAGAPRSEAINVLFLQREQDALRIYGNIVDVKCEFDSFLEDEIGPRCGFYRDPIRLTNFIKTFYDDVKISPQEVEYVEALGSAVPEVDKMELAAFEEVYCKDRKTPLLVGSVMSNIGYVESASGISSITKVLLGYQTGKIAANLHCDNPRQDVEAIKDGRIRIVTEHQELNNSYVAVSGLSITGINSHVLLKGPTKRKDLSLYKSNIPYLVFASGRQESAVAKILDDIKSRPIDPEEIALLHNVHKRNIRGHLARGYTILGTDENNQTVSFSQKSTAFDETKRPLCFVYSGMGSQWTGMGAQLMKIPTFAAAIDKCRRVLEPKGIDIIHIITSNDKKIFDNILNSFVGIAAIQIGLTDVLREVGMYPDKIIGHSVGELGCAYADGCFTAEEMILAAASRGQISLQTTFIRGSMAAVGLGFKDISKLCPPEIMVACHNGPESSTISGPADIMKSFVDELTKKGIFAKEVPCSNIAYHSKYIADAGPGLLKYLKEVIKDPKPRSERWLSTSVPQERWDEPLAQCSSAEYHTNNLLNPVLFEETSQLLPSNAVLIEIAPHGLLQAILKRSMPDTCKNIAVTKRGHPDNARLLLEAIGELYVNGYHPNVESLYPKVSFPVSNGTPMLSHLVEWNHDEKWSIPMFMPANRTTSSTCHYIITVHDDDSSYLKGHVIGGKNLYPYAAVLVKVWDTLAMILGVEKQKLSVQFQELHFYTQPILDESKQLRLDVSLHRGTGKFEVTEGNTKVITGYILGEVSAKRAIPNLQTENTKRINSYEIYQLFNAKDYEYTDDFQSIVNTNISLTEAQIAWKNNWVTLIDGLFQLSALRRNHETVSQVTYVRRLTIDVNEHAETKLIETNGTTIIDANFIEIQDFTKCGGLVMENVLFHDVPSSESSVALKALQFVPYFPTADSKESTALNVFFQIVAENLDKKNFVVVDIVSDNSGKSYFDDIKSVIKNIPGLELNYTTVERSNVLEERDGFLSDVDLILVSDLATDEYVSQMLYRVLKRDTFVINKEKYNEESETARPASLYEILSSHSVGETKLQLARWRPSESNEGASAFTVRSESDIALLTSTLNSLPPNQKLIVFTSHPPVDGLKDIIQQWRNEKNRTIHLVMINENVTVTQEIPSITYLANNILNESAWGGEYFVPVQEKATHKHGIVLRSAKVGDFDSMHWEQAPEPIGDGVLVKVQYAAINNVHVKVGMGVESSGTTDIKKLVEVDFSGVTQRGQRVMGLTQHESISTFMKAKPELLWPVPKDWSLEDAATVPLAYCMAFYCFNIKSKLHRDNTVLIHGGTGALGQAAISLALQSGCEVFTTVGDNSKKQFLKKLFPSLKDDHIGNSRDFSFGDMVLNATNGVGCDIVLSCGQGDLKNISLKVCATSGIVFDTTILPAREDFNLGMFHLTRCRSYFTTNLSGIFEPENINELRLLQELVSDGIASGVVRPLSRMVYSASDVPRAFRLLAASKHRGRVLLNLQQDVPSVQPRYTCSPDSWQILLSFDDVLGIQLAERLIHRGARKLIFQLPWKKESSLLSFKLRSWESQGVKINVTYGNIENDDNLKQLIQQGYTSEVIESIFYIISPDHQYTKMTKFLKQQVVEAKKFSSSLRTFAVIDYDSNEDRGDLLSSNLENVLITRVILPRVKTIKDDENDLSENMSISETINAIEKALCLKQSVVFAHRDTTPRFSLLQELAEIGAFTIPADVSTEAKLEDLGMDLSRTETVRSYLLTHNISLSQENILKLTIKEIQEIEHKIISKTIEEVRGFESFVTQVEPDELMAITEIVSLPTLTNNAYNVRDDEFDVSQKYLIIIPGIEGHYGRFRTLCERLKVPALLLQPELDRPYETIQRKAQRNIQILLKKTEMKDRFTLLGYESGVLVALEMASILEETGMTGTVYCIGGSPDEVQAIVNQKLSDYNTEKELQLAVLRYMYNLITNDSTESLDIALRNASSWTERLSTCVELLINKVQYSKQYLNRQIEVVYARVLQLRLYNGKHLGLRSQLVFLHPNENILTNRRSYPSQNYSQLPIIEYQLEKCLAHAIEDLRCAAIINRHLDNDVLEAFENKNLCESYIIGVNNGYMRLEK